MKSSAFGIDSYFAEKTRTAPEDKLDARTKYELLLCSFIEENLIKYPAAHLVRATQLPNMLNETFTDYCLLITTNVYNITVIKTKVNIDYLPDNNDLVPATYRCALLNKQCKLITRLGETTSKNIYNLFARGKFK